MKILFSNAILAIAFHSTMTNANQNDYSLSSSRNSFYSSEVVLEEATENEMGRATGLITSKQSQKSVRQQPKRFLLESLTLGGFSLDELCNSSIGPAEAVENDSVRRKLFEEEMQKYNGRKVSSGKINQNESGKSISLEGIDQEMIEELRERYCQKGDSIIGGSSGDSIVSRTQPPTEDFIETGSQEPVEVSTSNPTTSELMTSVAYSGYPTSQPSLGPVTTSPVSSEPTSITGNPVSQIPTSAPSTASVTASPTIGLYEVTNNPTDIATSLKTAVPTLSTPELPVIVAPSPTTNAPLASVESYSPSKTFEGEGTEAPTVHDCAPSASPAEINECPEAFVYCPGRSVCFTDESFNNGTAVAGKDVWGWNIYFDASTTTTVDDCEIWMGVKGCDLNSGTKVGTATFTKDLFHFCLDIDKYESNSYQLYAGKCEASDGGLHSSNSSDSGSCNADDVAKYASEVEKFPLVEFDGEYTSVFLFSNTSMSSNEEVWPGYSVFPIGVDGKNFLVGHVWVCPIDSNRPSPTSTPTGDFIENGSPTPILSPASLEPTIPPTLVPSSLPTKSPTLSPTKPPSFNPTLAPTLVPTIDPTTAPTLAPTTSTPTRGEFIEEATPTPTLSPNSLEPTLTPSLAPTSFPSPSPTQLPTKNPSFNPTLPPIPLPTSDPTRAPTSVPTLVPTSSPTLAPTSVPTKSPSLEPTEDPSSNPTLSPTQAPTMDPTLAPTSAPTLSPTLLPSLVPSVAPTSSPTVVPTFLPTDKPSAVPTSAFPSSFPSDSPSIQPTMTPTTRNPTTSPTTSNPTHPPTTKPTSLPTFTPTLNPSANPSVLPSVNPTSFPSDLPSSIPSATPTSNAPTRLPTGNPSTQPTGVPSINPSSIPSYQPTVAPVTATPSTRPSVTPTTFPSTFPSDEPSTGPTPIPTEFPTTVPTDHPTASPTVAPITANPSTVPSNTPTMPPSDYPSNIPSQIPSFGPSWSPSSLPSFYPSDVPTQIPTMTPSVNPTVIPSMLPSSFPSAEPSEEPSAYPSDLPTAVISDSPSVFLSFSPSSSPTDLPSMVSIPEITSKPTISSPQLNDVPSKSPISTGTPMEGPTTNDPHNCPTSTPIVSPVTAEPTGGEFIENATPSPTGTNIPTTDPVTGSPLIRAPIGIPSAGAPVIEPVTPETPSVAPETGSPLQQPFSGTPTKSPTTGSPNATPVPTAMPLTGTPSTAPVSGTPFTSLPSSMPITGAPTASPVTGFPTQVPVTANPITETPTVGPETLTPFTRLPSAMPVTGGPTATPVTNVPTGAPVSSNPTVTPYTSTPSGTPIETPAAFNPMTAPISSPSVSTPVNGTPTSKPTTGTPTATPITGSPFTEAPITGAPTATAPITEAPITGNPTTSPITSNPTATPITGTPTATPITGTPTAAPITGTPTAAPVTGIPTAKPVTGTPSVLPITGMPTLAPVTSTPTAAPVTGVPTLSPVTSTPTLAPVTGTPTLAPVTGTPTLAPVTGTPTLAPVTGTPTLAPVTGVPTDAPITGTPTVSPITGNPTASPITGNPSAAPVTGIPTATPITGNPTSAPITGTPNVAPMTATPITGTPVAFPFTSTPPDSVSMIPTPSTNEITYDPHNCPTASPAENSTSIPISIPTLSPITVQVPILIPNMVPFAVDIPTASPITLIPLGTPTGNPTVLIPIMPTSFPTRFPVTTQSEQPIEIPIAFPTTSPTNKPTGIPSVMPITGSPTAIPSTQPTPEFVEQGSEEPSVGLVTNTPTSSLDCASAFVYCPGRSTCFDDFLYKNVSVLGFNILYDTDSGTVDNCDILVGFDACNPDSATKVGTFSISPDSVTFELEKGLYTSNSFQFYAGRCRGNDGGESLVNGGFCDNGVICDYAADVSTYPLVSADGPFVDIFTFDAAFSTSGRWPNYPVFPIGDQERWFLSAHADVCKIVSPELTSVPTSAPSVKKTTPIPTNFPVVTPITNFPVVTPITNFPIVTAIPTPVFKENGSREPSVDLSSLSPTSITSSTVECVSAYVYCPGRSTCFDDIVYKNSTLMGWNIQYDAASGVVEECDIIIGYDGCNAENSTKVGTFTITPTSVTYELEKDVYTSRGFHFYAGQCRASDGGGVLKNGGFCSNGDICDFADDFQNYPLVSTDGPYVDTFTFDASFETTSGWPDYEVFPIGEGYRLFLTGHADVCLLPPSGTNGPTPVFGGQGSVVPVPSPSPTLFPIAATSASPLSLAPTMSPVVATLLPTSTLTPPPTVFPSLRPTQKLTSPPTTSPFTLTPSVSPTPLTSLDCVSAYVYCPGISTCFDDIVYKNTSLWGWNIQYDASLGVIDDCEILIDYDGCNPENATKVGTFTITPTSVTYELDKDFYTSKGFHFYSGQCRASDGGSSANNGGFCDNGEICLFADDFMNYPLVSNNGPYVDTFTFDASFETSTRWPEYEAFPIGSGNRLFLTAHADVCIIPQIDPPFGPDGGPETLPPTNSPSAVRQLETFSPSSTFGETGLECISAFAYCPDKSECFSSVTNKDGAITGWNIIYMAEDGVLDDCELYVGAGDKCDMSNAIKIGSLEITTDSVTYNLDSELYIPSEYHFYSGVCEASDGANFFANGGFCSDADVCAYADKYTEYPLVSKVSSDQTSFSFDAASEISGPWPSDYEVFPLGQATRMFMTAHVLVCPNLSQKTNSDLSWPWKIGN